MKIIGVKTKGKTIHLISTQIWCHHTTKKLCHSILVGCGQTKIQGYDPFLCWMIHEPNKNNQKIHYISWALVDGVLIQGWHRKNVNPGQKASCMKVSMAKLDPGFEITHVNPAPHFWCYGCLQPCEAPLNWVDGRTLRLQNGRIVSLGCHLPWRGVLGPGFIWFSWVRAVRAQIPNMMVPPTIQNWSFLVLNLSFWGSAILRNQHSPNSPKDETSTF